jgi:hypothetical protein
MCTKRGGKWYTVIYSAKSGNSVIYSSLQTACSVLGIFVILPVEGSTLMIKQMRDEYILDINGRCLSTPLIANSYGYRISRDLILKYVLMYVFFYYYLKT